VWYVQIISVRFSPNAKNIAYVAAVQGKSFIVVNGKKTKELFHTFLKGVSLQWEGNDWVRGMALRLPEPEFFRVEVEVK